jgi:hypothetical protein
MTYAEVLAFPRGSRVRLADGRVGRIESWHQSTESISIRLDIDGPVTLRAAELQPADDGLAVRQPAP